MVTVFLLQIVRPDGTVVRLPGGGPLERDLIEACVARLPYVGLLKTQEQVKAAVRTAMAEAIQALKQETLFVVHS